LLQGLYGVNARDLQTDMYDRHDYRHILAKKNLIKNSLIKTSI